MIGDLADYRKLNMKKVIIVILIILLLIISITVFIISRNIKKPIEKEEVNNETNLNNQSNVETFYSIDNLISIEVPKKYELTSVQNSEYLIKLTSEYNMNIYISKMDKEESRPLSSIARADQLAYTEEYNAISNLSKIKELSVNDRPAYTYSFHYLDENLKQAFFLQVVLLQIDNEVYVFDMDFPLNDLTLYTNLVKEVLENFKKY